VVTSPVCEYDAPVLAAQSDKPPLLRTLLILGRVSNLPTVWSNCLAGWLLAGGTEWIRFTLLCIGASLLYIGGMFLNDACDVRFDTAHRQERPIPSGAISARAVWLWSAALLLGGSLLLAELGLTTALLTLGLVLCIVAYDLVHKQTALAPLLMAGCRFLLYLVAGSAALNGLSAKLLWCAGALALYIVGLSFIARKEAQNVKPDRRASAALMAPVVLALLSVNSQNVFSLNAILIGFLIWVTWSLRRMTKGGAPAIGRTVSALLAGIVLVDMLAVQGGGGMMPLAFLALFVSALILQRTIPAT
jgi:4-hydroxybenzoate polyprenyltransferase